MFITEFFDNVPDDYKSEDEDNSVPTLSDVRKTRLTLAQINKIRVMDDLRKYEREQEIVLVQNQYGSTEEEAEF